MLVELQSHPITLSEGEARPTGCKWYVKSYSKPLPFSNLYVINVASRTDRLVDTMDMFNLIHLKPIVINAIDKKLYSDLNNPGWKACLESHRTALRQVVLNNDSLAIIFEDDIDFTLDLPLQLRRIHHHTGAEFDIIMLGHCSESDGGSLLTQITTNNYTIQVRESVHPFCGHAYAVSNDGARKMLRFLDWRFGLTKPWKGSIHFDSTFSSLRVRNAKMYSVFPPIVMQRKTSETASTHGDEFYEQPQGFKSVYNLLPRIGIIRLL